MKLQDLKHDKSKAYIQMREKIELWLKEHTEIEGTYSINVNGVVDVHGDVFMEDIADVVKPKQISVQFGVVTGDFFCNYNNLTSLVGAPQRVGGDFSCHNNILTTLKGAPREVGGDVDCTYNKLTTLEGSPREVGGDYFCHNNKLNTLRGAPREVGGEFDCSDNNLTSLVGGPREVGDNFICVDNKFKTEPDHSFIKIGGELFWE